MTGCAWIYNLGLGNSRRHLGYKLKMKVDDVERLFYSLLFLVTKLNTVLDHKPLLQGRRFHKVYIDEEGVEREFSCII